MRTLLRCLIALNWLVVALASNGFFVRRYAWGGCCRDLALGDTARDRPDLEPGSETYNEHFFPRMAEYSRRTEPAAKAGDWGWVVAIATGTATAVGLMIVFPRLQNGPSAEKPV